MENEHGFILLDCILGLSMMIIIVFLIYSMKANELKAQEIGLEKQRQISETMQKKWEDYREGCDFKCTFEKDLQP